ncbi:MAG: DUF5320 domain-containing protein, partial [Bacteroidales bacterium]|nr:DUF5320 domain-containing protein [Bacteroidales bacterium]
PGTGRAFGYCHGFDSPGCFRRTGMGSFSGRGSGRGYGYGFYRPFQGFGPGYLWNYNRSREDEIRLLRSQSEFLGQAQKNIEKRLKELEKEGE